MIARKKAKLAEETSDLNTEEETTRKRKRIVRTMSSSSEEFETILPSPPKIKKIRKGLLVLLLHTNIYMVHY